MDQIQYKDDPLANMDLNFPVPDPEVKVPISEFNAKHGNKQEAY